MQHTPSGLSQTRAAVVVDTANGCLYGAFTQGVRALASNVREWTKGHHHPSIAGIPMCPEAIALAKIMKSAVQHHLLGNVYDKPRLGEAGQVQPAGLCAPQTA